MGNVTLNFSEEEYRIFRKYCANYCHLYDESRKNSIRIFLELFQRRFIDVREHSLENAFLFFYEKKQEAESDVQASGNGPAALMRLRLCTDIIAFLNDLEKIYILLHKKGIDANYILILGAFFKMFEDDKRRHQEDLYSGSAAEINAIVLPLHNAIERKLKKDADTRSILCELGGFVAAFNSLSPDFTISDELVTIIGISLLKTFSKEVPGEEIPALIRECLDKAETDDFECALEGKPRAHATGDLDCSWDDMKKLLRILNERIAQAQGPGRLPQEVISALAIPGKVQHELAEYPGMSLSRYEGGVPRKRHDEHRFLIHVDSRPASEVSVSPILTYTSAEPGSDDPYKPYYPVTFGALALIIMILATMAVPLVISEGGTLLNITSPAGKTVASEKAGTISVIRNSGVAVQTPEPTQGGPAPDAGIQSGITVPEVEALVGVAALNMPVTPEAIPVRTKAAPTPVPILRYVTIEPVPVETDVALTSASHRKLFTSPENTEDLQYDLDDYVSIYHDDWEFSNANAFRVTFDLKNPPMVIHYSVIPYNITDKKWFSPRDAAKLIDTAIVVRPFEWAWYTITVSVDGEPVDRVGWGKDYGTPLDEQVVVLRNAGTYQLEFAGDYVRTDMEIFVKKEGNIGK